MGLKLTKLKVLGWGKLNLIAVSHLEQLNRLVKGI